MVTITNTLSTELVNLLDEKAEALGVSNEKLIEIAVRNYLDQLDKIEYIKSFQSVTNDASNLLNSEDNSSVITNQLINN